MGARYSYSPYEVADPLAQYPQSGVRRFVSAVGRFFYRLIVLTLVLGALGGILFALYRDLERRIGIPGWGTPRSIELPKETPAAAPVAASPSEPTEAKDTAAKEGETVQAAAKSEIKGTTPDGLPIVSFDSLPTLRSKAAPEAVSLSALPEAQPARVARSEAAPARPPHKAARAEKAKPVELTRSIPLPKAPPKPEPVAKAAPAPKPEPPAPKPEPEVDRTKPRAGDNPLKAAIRAAMAGKPKASE
jgi:hypothetical protein